MMPKRFSDLSTDILGEPIYEMWMITSPVKREDPDLIIFTLLFEDSLAIVQFRDAKALFLQ
jgi:hypothetical protein